jgi:hypothetical protein
MKKPETIEQLMRDLTYSEIDTLKAKIAALEAEVDYLNKVVACRNARISDLENILRTLSINL